MKCTNCGTENFDVAVKCARCHAPLSNINPVYRSTPDPEPPTQISGSGFQKVRFGPAPTEQRKTQPKKMRRPPAQVRNTDTESKKNMGQPIANNPIVKQPLATQHVSKDQNTEEHDLEKEPSVVLFGAFALSLGISFVMLCIDFYSFFLQLQSR